MERITRNPGPVDVWLIVASSGEYHVEAETAGHAIITFMRHKPDDFVHAVCSVGEDVHWELREIDPHDRSYGSQTMNFGHTGELLTLLGFDEGYAVWAVKEAREKGKQRATPDDSGYRVQVDHAGDGRFTVTVHSRKN